MLLLKNRLVTEIGLESYKNRKYIQIKNKWKYIDNRRKCCEGNCVNTKTPTGKCKNGNGFIEIINDTDIKYNKCIEGKGENKRAHFDAEIRLNKPKNKCNFASLFYYYEIKIKKEGPEYSAFGFRNTKEYILLENNGYICYESPSNTAEISFQIPSFSWKDGDVFGCGLVFPPTKMLEKNSYVFFTQNGNQIGKAILLKEESVDYFDLYLSLYSHSIEANFGNDLEAKPYCFDISKHLFAEEFYN
uniref:SPRY domain-containing protein n=1 Tax=Meloidogyne incognita TaxID=6306 RepID=A0A914N9V0_MELIC